MPTSFSTRSVSSPLMVISLLAALLPGVSVAAEPVDNPALFDTRWALQAIDDTPPVSGGHGAVAFLVLQAGSQQLSGSTACNRIQGRYTQRGTQLTLTALASTRMACAEPLMQQEQRLIELLKATDGYRIEGQVMSLLQGETVRLRFRAWPVR